MSHCQSALNDKKVMEGQLALAKGAQEVRYISILVEQSAEKLCIAVKSELDKTRDQLTCAQSAQKAQETEMREVSCLLVELRGHCQAGCTENHGPPQGRR